MANEQASNGEVLPTDGRRILILYGSETGNSHDFAIDLETMAERLRFRADVFAIDTITLKTLTQYPLVILVISTTGQGEMPKNSRLLWKRLLSKRLPPTVFKNVNFTTFGLGDSSYRQYNWAARKFHKRLLQLGASEFYPRGEADERHEDGIDGAFLPWLISLRSHLLSEWPLPEGVLPIPQDVPLPPKVILERDSVAAKDKVFHRDHLENVDSNGLDCQTLRFGQLSVAGQMTEEKDTFVENGAKKDQAEEPYTGDKAMLNDLLPIPESWTATVECNDRLTPDGHWQDVRQLKLDVLPRAETEDRFLNNAGDSVVLYPRNFPEDVQALIDLMNWNDVADEPFRHYLRGDGATAEEYTPPNCYSAKNSSLRQLLTNNYDITAIPKRSFFDSVRFFASDPMQKERLEEFSDPKYIDEFYDYTTRPRRSILEILQDFLSIKISYQHIPSMFPLIRGREYSIASAGKLSQPGGEASPEYHVELLIALVKYKTVLRKTRRGLCSRYVESLQPGSRINITLNRRGGPFVSNKQIIERPLLCIATGTGVAPIRAVFWEREQERESSHGPNHLFYGSRNEKADFFFKDEWPKLDVEVHTAFSRDQKQKIYVQDVIRTQWELVCSLIKAQATIAVCGSSGAMPEAVKNAIAEVMVRGGVVDPNVDAWDYLVRNNMVWEEVW
ncbi:hypothetical protein PFICI_05656 [Pestalotiopsis fici W106-1]|uniref:NADPH-dependent diflavin oxidoreductase 1 n=1 Tax=Pestalotiopsis fici (strain W106-1 / CGMCC3.15140) TaxID=1229662 RepID=W3XCK2_PESFW|nr:uncharacterized protein PFICI_05656 [Pestalotiopsis fici W106-1]ETS83780.1 hypothetical protein PFICI_05656 [Pestalotiopsis fici W106-1]